MAKKTNKEVKKLIKLFVQSLKKDIPVEKVFMFGSYVKGNPTKDSDIDLIVVSSFFEKGKRIKHMQYLFRKAAKVSPFLEPIPASPSEIKNPDKRLFLGQVLKSAKAYNFSEVKHKRP
jgi:predicted nucleotidyltransferase